MYKSINNKNHLSTHSFWMIYEDQSTFTLHSIFKTSHETVSSLDTNFLFSMFNFPLSATQFNYCISSAQDCTSKTSSGTSSHSNYFDCLQRILKQVVTFCSWWYFYYYCQKSFSYYPQGCWHDESFWWCAKSDWIFACQLLEKCYEWNFMVSWSFCWI